MPMKANKLTDYRKESTRNPDYKAMHSLGIQGF